MKLTRRKQGLEKRGIVGKHRHYLEVRMKQLISFVRSDHVLYCCLVMCIGLCLLATSTAKAEEPGADLVLIGVLDKVEMINGSVCGDGMVGDPTKILQSADLLSRISFVAYFSALKVTKGEFDKAEFKVLLHSPAQSFGVKYDDYNSLPEKKTFKLFMRQTEKGREVLAIEPRS